MHPDIWHSVAKYFAPRDLTRCMRVSREWFFLWVADRAWSAQRARLCAKYPGLADIFDVYSSGSDGAGEHLDKRSMRSNSNKKRKTAWIMPRSGIWYTMRKMCTTPFKKICAQPVLYELAFAMLRENIPRQETIGKCNLIDTRPAHKLRVMFTIEFWHGEDAGLIFEVRNSQDNLDVWYFCMEKDVPIRYYDLYYEKFVPDPFRCSTVFDYFLRPWRKFLLCQTATRIWTPTFERIMGE
jgi:hypothetical protein